MSYGAVVHAAVRERRDARVAAENGSRETYLRAHARALERGFTVREAPWVAVAVTTRPGLRTVGQIRAYLRDVYGWLLYEEEETP